jgi:O-acetyl-ADP-ribose deacetylase (regulator of RNase III)
VKIIKGDLIALAKSGQFDYILHGCNCFCTMGAGIAAVIAANFSAAREVDLGSRKGDIFKLGDYTKAKARIGSIKYLAKIQDNPSFTIINAYTQYQPGKDFKLWALESVLWKFIQRERITPDVKVGVPLIGCGIGGGNETLVRDLLFRYSRYMDLTLVEFEIRPKETRETETLL